MNALTDTLRALVASLHRSARGVRGLVLALVVPAVAALVLVAALAPALNASARIPVAVVNLDKGATDDNGRKVQAGTDFVDSLSDSTELAWDVVDEQTANDGLARGDYALILEIPEAYSQQVASLTGSTPEQAQLRIISDGTTNVLATQEGTAVLRQVQTRLRTELGENYLLNVLNDVRGQASTLTLTADGAVMLDSAYEGLEQGTSAIAEGLEQTAEGTDALAQGVDGIAQGVTAAGTGAQQLAAGMDATSTQLVEPLAAGAQGVATGVTAVAGKTEQLGAGITQMGQSLQQASDALDASLEGLSAVSDVAPQLGDQATSLSNALGTMQGATTAMDTAAQTMVDGVDAAQQAVTPLQDQALALADTLDAQTDDSNNPDIVAQFAALCDAYEQALTDQVNAAQHRAEAANATAADAAAADSADGTAADTGAAAQSQQTADDASTEVAALEQQLESLKAQRSQLQDRLTGAARDARSVSDAANTAASGVATLASGRDALAAAGETYDAAAQDAQAAASGLVDLSSQLAEPARNAALSMVGVTETVRTVAPLITASGSGVTAIGQALTPLGQGAQGIATGTAALPQVLDTFSTATAGIGQGNSALGQALSAVGTGVSGLGEGIGAMAQVQGQLASGVGQLRQGQQTINDTLSSAGDTLSKLSSNYDDRADVASAPVSLTTTAHNRVESAASALAPTVVAMVLWAGAVLAALVVPAVDKRAVLAGRLSAGVLPALLTTCGIGLLQALVVAIVMIVFGGAVPANLPAFALLVVLGALACAALTQAIRVLCGRAAPVVLVLALALQLVCAGSILPASFAGGIFAALGSVLPVPVLAEGLRGAVSGSLAGLGGACAVPAVWCAIALAITFVTARAHTHIRPERVFAG